jgi:hypothetical protein
MSTDPAAPVEPPISLIYLRCKKCDGDVFYLTGLNLTATCVGCGTRYPSRVPANAFGLEEA